MIKRILKSFTNKKFRYGAFSTLTALFVIAILLVVNLVAGQLNLSYDLTPNKLYSITDKTKEIIKELDQDITIYALFKTGQENDLYKELLEQYSSNSGRINLVYKDPYLYPQFVESYAKDGEDIPVNSLIVESSKRSKVIKAGDLVTSEFDYNTFESKVTSVDIEPQVTNAINYVMQDKTSTIYKVSNHNEDALPSDLLKEINMANYDVVDLDLLTTSEIPDDCSILLVTTPSIDWTVDEAQMVKDYLQNYNNAIFLIDYTFKKYENMESVLETYGVGLGDYMIVEGNANNYLQNNPIWLIPNMVSHDITDSFMDKNFRLLLPSLERGVRGIEELSLKKNSTKIEPLFSSSKESYGKSNAEATSVEKEQGDVDGPFNIGVAVTDTVYTDQANETKLIVVGSSYLVDSRIGGNNYEFFMKATNWLEGQQESIYISSKTGYSSSLEFTQQQALYMIVLSVLAIPIVILGTGLFVWLRRRHS